MPLTAKQEAWDAYKMVQRAERTYEREYGRGPVTTIAHVRRMTKRHCPDCPHRWKGHKKSGRCKNGCDCSNGALRRPRRG